MCRRAFEKEIVLLFGIKKSPSWGFYIISLLEAEEAKDPLLLQVEFLNLARYHLLSLNHLFELVR